MNDLLLWIAASPLVVLAVAVAITVLGRAICPPDVLSDDEAIILARSREVARG